MSLNIFPPISLLPNELNLKDFTMQCAVFKSPKTKPQNVTLTKSCGSIFWCFQLLQTIFNLFHINLSKATLSTEQAIYGITRDIHKKTNENRKLGIILMVMVIKVQDHIPSTFIFLKSHCPKITITTNYLKYSWNTKRGRWLLALNCTGLNWPEEDHVNDI